MDKIVTQNGFRIDKVHVDLTWHKDSDHYSDGDIENELLDCVRNQQIDELLHNDNRWPVIYHLSPVRENIVSWIPFKKTDRVLEIGSGCGAVSGVMASKAGWLECVEISPRRAEISAWRNHDYDNMVIHVGNLNDMEFTEKFDYVTLIGVLEYAGTFTHTDNPYEDFLQTCRKFLKPEGTLIIAIENRLGMKYWSGAREDHTGKRFDGILNYPYPQCKVRTFARQELISLLIKAGLDEQSWYYPYPDYKLPLEIHSDSYLPNSADIKHFDLSVFDQERIEIFSEVQAMAGICDAGLYPEFSNSFVVLCRNSQTDMPARPLPAYIHYNGRRKRDYEIITEIWQENGQYVVYKKAQNKLAIRHLQTIAENCRILSDEYGAQHVAQAELINRELLKMEYVEGTSFMELLISGLHEGGIGLLKGYIEYYTNNILQGSDTVNLQDWQSEVELPSRKYNLDLNFENVRVRNDDFVIIDYEWMLPKVSKKYVLYRALFYLDHECSDILQRYGLSLEALLKSAGISEQDVKTYRIMEGRFYHHIADDYYAGYKKNRLAININV